MVRWLFPEGCSYLIRVKAVYQDQVINEQVKIGAGDHESLDLCFAIAPTPLPSPAVVSIWDNPAMWLAIVAVVLSFWALCFCSWRWRLRRPRRPGQLEVHAVQGDC
jgi:hypothetical protein